MVAVTENWNQFARIRQDLWGFADLIWCRPDKQEIGLVQTTTAANQSARMHKILALPAAKGWLESGGEIQVHGWRKGGARGARKTWTCNVTRITLSDFPSVAPVEEFAVIRIPVMSLLTLMPWLRATGVAALV